MLLSGVTQAGTVSMQGRWRPRLGLFWASKAWTSHSTLSSHSAKHSFFVQCPPVSLFTNIHNADVILQRTYDILSLSHHFFRGKSMSKVRPSSMYSKSQEAEEEEQGEENGDSAFDFLLTFVSIIFILITFPFSFWKCIKVMKVGALKYFQYIHCPSCLVLATDMSSLYLRST